MKLTHLTLIITAAGFLLTLFTHRQILHVFAAPEYLSVSGYLPWMLLSGGLFAAGQTVGLDLMSQLKTREMIPAKIATAVTGTLMNFAGGYWRGLAGIVIASNIFSAMYLAWMMILAGSEGGEKSFAPLT